MLPEKCAPRRACNVYNDLIRCEVPPPNLNFANIFYARFGAKLPNLMTANIYGYMVGCDFTLGWIHHKYFLCKIRPDIA